MNLLACTSLKLKIYKALLRRKQVSNVFTVNFKSRHLDPYCLSELLFASIDLLLKHESSPWEDACLAPCLEVFIDESVAEVLPLSAWPLHGVSLSCAGLPISENTDVHTVKSRLHEGFDLFEHL